MTPRLRTWFCLEHEAAYVTTLGLNGQVMANVSNSRQTDFTVQCMENISPVQESEVLVVPIRAYNLVFRLRWFRARNPDVDWQSVRLFALRTPGGAQEVAMDWVNHQECPGNVPGSTAREEACSEG